MISVSVLLAAFAVFIGLVMRAVGSHKMMLVGRCKNIITSQYGCTMSKVVKRKFEDQEDTERAPDADAAFGAPAVP